MLKHLNAFSKIILLQYHYFSLLHLNFILPNKGDTYLVLCSFLLSSFPPHYPLISPIPFHS
ncbi:hypothetical protein Lalb_Chr15g0083011 [Lupinus albus]|uniref:Uncharacterized protein n=1 Tax=Lupinus albus TaxID=3870 RepID=A0A6A4PDN3_LUPAL|nr:hypothetical protein Lalb_Chr15g0083011 [Lupinus albus]